jgi:hypothetical protein
MNKKLLALSLSSVLAFGGILGTTLPAGAVGEGPNYNGNESIQNRILHTYDEMVDYLKVQDAKQDKMVVKEIG